ncbi:MAG: D-alanine--D-alanine ligase [Pantoea sp. Brub]|nr:D-alanine--D-alanine ligase [Pantoea sp. Brub]
MNEKIAVLMGGTSSERKISLMSGKAILSGLNEANINAYGVDTLNFPILNLKQKGFSKVFCALHGKGGEDGTLQALLNFLQVPYTGSGVMASSIAMDKIRTKLIWKGYNLPSARFVWCNRNKINTFLSKNVQHNICKLGLPLFIKPNCGGSSIGITKITEFNELSAALENAFKYDDNILVEECLNGTEYSIGILDDKVLPIIQIETSNQFYNFEAKYFSKQTKYFFSNNLNKNQKMKLTKLVLTAWKILGCTGYGRIDVMTDQNGFFHLLEINTSPGMTRTSLFPMAAKQAGISFSQLVTKILRLSN